MKYIPLLFSIFLVISCNQIDGTTHSKYEYKFHVDKDGDSPKVGDLVVFHEKVYLNNEEIFSTEKHGQKEIILPSEDILTKPLPPNYEILFKMSEGDSVSVTQELKNMDNLPKGYQTDDVMKYVVKLVKFFPKEKRPQRKKKARTSSNYPYEIFTQTGNIIAQAGDRVRYREYRYLNDSLIYSTITEKPTEAFLPFRNEVPTPPPGNYEALLLLGEGDSLRLSQLLADLPELPSYFKSTDTINYNIKVLEILTPAEYVIEKKIKQAKAEFKKKAIQARKETVKKMTISNIEKYKNGDFEEKLLRTHSGLKYLIHEKGNGKKLNPKQQVSIHYYGFLMDGKEFDNSFEKGEPLQFLLGMGRVIKGWDEGLSKLNVGTKATFFIPYQLAYGEAGRPPKIPQRADLVFYVEVVE